MPLKEGNYIYFIKNRRIQSNGNGNGNGNNVLNLAGQPRMDLTIDRIEVKSDKTKTYSQLKGNNPILFESPAGQFIADAALTRGKDGIYVSYDYVDFGQDCNIFKTGIRIADLSNENDIRNGGISNSGIEGTFPIQTYRNYQQQETVGEGTVTTPISCFQRTLGERIYECSDHLGNVRVVIGDKRMIEEETIAYENDFSTPLGSEIVANEAGTFQLVNDQLEVTTTAINDGVTFNITGLEDHQEYILTYELDETGMDVTGLNSLGELVDANQGLNAYTFTSNGQSITFEFISATGAGVFLMNNVKLATPELAKAEMMAYNDYYPFGMLQPGRNQQSDAYRYGYQGSEKDDEVKGEGNSYTTYYRMLDPRLGRWFSVDPKATSWESPYVSMGNNPVRYNDVMGDSIPTVFKGEDGKVLNSVPDDIQKMYNQEYGIEVAYNSKTKQLYYKKEVYTELRVSKSAKKKMVRRLKSSRNKGVGMVFGYDLTFTDIRDGNTKEVIVGQYAPKEIDGSKYGTVYLDMADHVNGTGMTKVKDNTGVEARTLNLARTIEHEYLGHAIKGLNDTEFQDDWWHEGGVVKLVNRFRKQMDLQTRLHYKVYQNDGSVEVFFGKRGRMKAKYLKNPGLTPSVVYDK